MLERGQQNWYNPLGWNCKDLARAAKEARGSIDHGNIRKPLNTMQGWSNQFVSGQVESCRFTSMELETGLQAHSQTFYLVLNSCRAKPIFNMGYHTIQHFKIGTKAYNTSYLTVPSFNRRLINCNVRMMFWNEIHWYSFTIIIHCHKHDLHLATYIMLYNLCNNTSLTYIITMNVYTIYTSVIVMMIII